MGCAPKIRRPKARKKKKRTQTSVTTGAGGASTILMPRIPQKCDNCGAGINSEKVNWTGPGSVECPYCGSILSVEFEKIA